MQHYEWLSEETIALFARDQCYQETSCELKNSPHRVCVSCSAFAWDKQSLYFTQIYWHFPLDVTCTGIYNSTLHTETPHSNKSGNVQPLLFFVFKYELNKQNQFCHTLSRHLSHHLQMCCSDGFELILSENGSPCCVTR